MSRAPVHAAFALVATGALASLGAACSGGGGDWGGGGDSAGSREPARDTSEAIVGGTTDTTRPDVLILQDDTLAGFRCTATLIAPNLVITARHCVGKRSTGSALCRGNATDDGAASLPNYGGDASAAPMYLASSPSGALLARGATIYDDGSTTACAHDVALIGLDRKITSITPALLRRTAVAPGDPLVVMGFGWTDRMATINATERMKGTTSVLVQGPTVYTFQPLGDAMAAPAKVAIATGEIGVQGITMTGDSGGPAFDAMGRLTAVVSRGYADAYYGPGTLTTVAAHLATIDAALMATGNAPPAKDGGADAATPPPPDSGAGSSGTSPPAGNASDAGGSSGASAAAPPATGDASGCSASARPASLTTRASGALVSALLALFAVAVTRRRRRAT